jgi:PIN domain nuclease of toxin-antitoxin system
VKYLLDTHAFLWWITADKRLPAALRKHLERFRDPIYVSVVSLWEIVLKIRLGKLTVTAGPVEPYLLRQIEQNRFEVLTIHSHHVFPLLSLPPLHRDPFDRLLVAQSQVESLTLVTCDPEIKAYPVKTVWDQFQTE